MHMLCDFSFVGFEICDLEIWLERQCMAAWATELRRLMSWVFWT